MSQPDITNLVKPIIFREYIGIGDDITDFPDKIISVNLHNFHFILGFATDTYKEGKSTGVFHPSWNLRSFSPEKVATLKGKYHNVKVVISIGGDGLKPFNPLDNEDWIKKAVSSIRGIILDYKKGAGKDIIDGIDINYENITSTAIDFSNNIRQVIKQLKEDPDVSPSMNTVSIAPTPLLQSYYLKLYQDNKDNIDWINYKFYNQGLTPLPQTSDEFVSLFKSLVTDYNTESKLLVGVSSNASTIPAEIIVAGLEFLLSRELLAGAFVWNANTSAPTYTRERELQKLLTQKF